MGMVIRVLYNNQNWQARCSTPGKDDLCWRCFLGGLAIIRPDRNDKECSGDCWERRLDTEYRWGCIPKGRKFGNRARPGTKVFFVFQQPGGKKYTLWGKTTVRSVDSEPVKDGQEYEKGFAFVHFEPFEPLPKERWVPDLGYIQLVGAPWRMGLHRFINAQQEAELEQRIEGPVPEEPPVSSAADLGASRMALARIVTPTIYAKLKNIATNEGREVNEIVREAIAEWLKGREA